MDHSRQDHLRLDLLAVHPDLEVLVAWLHEGQIILAFVAAIDIRHECV